MAKNIEPTLKLISDYLKLEEFEKFVIPHYQRGYSWDIAQCEKLWQDIEAFQDSKSRDPYFFGTIIVDLSHPELFSLIDGQQRTTTFLLLLKALLVRLNEVIPKIEGDEDSLALKEGLDANRKAIMKILYKAEAEDIPGMLRDHSKTQGIVILQNESINEMYKQEVSTIIAEKDFEAIEQKVTKIPRKQKDNKYTNHFRNFKFFYTQLAEKTTSELNQFAKVFLNKCQVIEIRSWQIEQAITMFNSLNSTGMPLSDADIISAQLYSHAGDEHGKEAFNQQWEKINELVNELSRHNIVNINSVLQQFMYVKRALDQDNDVTTPGLRRYYIENQKHLLKEPMVFCAHLMKIANIWERIKDFAEVKLLLKFNENAKLYLISYLYRFDVDEIGSEQLTPICACLLRLFILLELDEAVYSSAKFKSFLFNMNLKLVNNQIDMETIAVDFNEHIHKNWHPDAISDAIVAYEKHLLVYVNEYLYAQEKGLPFDFADNVNVEHIMPASGGNVQMIRVDAGIADIDEFNALINQLGNKILLEEKINKSIGNQWFKTKKQNHIASKSGYQNSQYHIAQALTQYPIDEWTKTDIEQATAKASKRLLNFIFNTPSKRFNVFM